MTAGPPFFRNGAPPASWGEPEPSASTRDTSGLRLAADEVCRRILAGVVDQFALAGVDLPERRYLVPGAPDDVAWDCEQVTVAASGVGWGPATSAGTDTAAQAGSPLSAMGMRHLILEVAIVRQLPSGARLSDDSTSTATVPDVNDMMAAGVRHLQDMGVLSQALAELFGTNPDRVIIPAGTGAQPGLVRSMAMGDHTAVVGEVTVTLGETA